MNIFQTNKTRTDEELMARFQEGKKDAFDEIYARYSKRILGLMYRMLNGDEEQAQDLLQDLFIKIVERPELFDCRRNFKSWIFTVAANLCRNEYRKPIFTDLEDASITEQNYNQLIAQIDDRVFKKSLKRELAKLKYEHRATFILRINEKLSVKEVAEIMDCSEGAVKSRMFYAVQKLSAKLKIFNPVQTN